MVHKDQHDKWRAWRKERESFKERETNGFASDVAALEAHIHKLIEISPKDHANWPYSNATDIIDLLKQDLIRAKAIMEHR